MIKNVLQRLTMIAMLAFSMWTIAASIDSNNRFAFACTCAPPKSPQVSLEENSAVFSGKVVHLETAVALPPSKIAIFDVYTVWKGISQDPVRISTGMGGGDCGYPFEENKEYLVYAHGEEGLDLQASSCSLTKPLDRAAGDFLAIGLGDSSFAGDDVTVFERGFALITFPYLIGIGAAIAGTIAFLTLRKRK